MAYLLIQDFKTGLDRRRPQAAGEPGALWELNNAVISRGGDIETAKKFVKFADLPADTHGLLSVQGQISVFGNDAALDNGAGPVAGVPNNIRYQALPNGVATLTRILDHLQFEGKPYVIAEYNNGDILHWYDGALLTDWETVADASAEESTLLFFLADKLSSSGVVTASVVGRSILLAANTAGVPFTITTSVNQAAPSSDQTLTETVITAHVAAVDAAQSTATFQVTGGDVNGVLAEFFAGAVPLIGAPISYTGDPTTMANAIGVAVNSQADVHAYTAATVGDTVTIIAPADTNAGHNGTTLTANVTPTLTFVATNFAGGVDPVTAVAQVSRLEIGGTFEPTARFNVVLDGTLYGATGRASATGTSLHVDKRRMYSTAGTLLRYSALGDASDWTDPTATIGAGFINAAQETDDRERLVAVADYDDKVAVFSRSLTRIYSLSTDPLENLAREPLRNTGALARHSVLSYGTQDTYYLDETGIRSLRARDSSGAASVSDIGTAIDPYISDLKLTLTPAEISRSFGVVEPQEGRFWLALGPKILVISQFPGLRINAWSVLDQGFSVTALERSRSRVYARSTDAIYLYGGETGTEYIDPDESEVWFETPYLTANEPATDKDQTHYDTIAEGEWELELLTNPKNKNEFIAGGRVVGTTMNEPDVALPAFAAMFAVRMRQKSKGKSSVSQVAIHFDRGVSR